MAKPPQIRSPQFQTALIRKLKNVAPSCTVEIIQEMDRGIGFRLRDSCGRYRTNIVRLYRYHPDVLNKENLKRRIIFSGVPDAGLPRGF